MISMKNITVFFVLIASLLCAHPLQAQDDVYDAPVQRQPKAKVSKPVYSEPQERIVLPGRTQSYSESNDNSTARTINNNYYNNNNYSDDNYSDNDYYSNDFGYGYGYSDRIRRFHNPSMQFSYGWNNWNNNYYSSWNNYNNWKRK